MVTGRKMELSFKPQWLEYKITGLQETNPVTGKVVKVFRDGGIQSGTLPQSDNPIKVIANGNILLMGDKGIPFKVKSNGKVITTATLRRMKGLLQAM